MSLFLFIGYLDWTLKDYVLQTFLNCIHIFLAMWLGEIVVRIVIVLYVSYQDIYNDSVHW